MSRIEQFKRYRIFALLAFAALMAWVNVQAPSVNGKNPIVAPRTPSTGLSGPILVSPALVAQPIAIPPASPTVPVRLDRPILEEATRDPFALNMPVVPVAAPVKVAQAPITPVLPPIPPPQAPPHDITFAGRMVKPDGGEVVYVNYAGSSMTIATGQSLPNGYRVDAISAKVIELSYPPMNTKVRIELPDTPSYQIR